MQLKGQRNQKDAQFEKSRLTAALYLEICYPLSNLSVQRVGSLLDTPS